MRLPEITIIRKEELPDAPGWIDRILAPLNKFFKSIYNILDKKVTFDDNITSQKVNIVLTDNDLPYQIATSLEPFGVILCQIVEQGVGYHKAITSAVYVDWSFNEGYVKIENITGITSGTKYRLKLLII